MPRRLCLLPLLVAPMVLLVGCQAAQRQRDLAQLTEWMTGSFTSTDQHQVDPENYFDIHLHMAPIWPERNNGRWLYVEQAAASSLDQPYRQRVYHLDAGPNGSFKSEIYALPGDPLRFAGAWRDPGAFVDLTPDDLTLREGCTMILNKRPDGSFVGGTIGKGCESKLRGATYATSEALITASQLVSWGRGYDAAGKQVWGATAGGYIFKKTAEPQPQAAASDSETRPE